MDKQRGKGLGEFNIKKRGSSKMVYGLSRTGIKGGGQKSDRNSTKRPLRNLKIAVVVHLNYF